MRTDRSRPLNSPSGTPVAAPESGRDAPLHVPGMYQLLGLPAQFALVSVLHRDDDQSRGVQAALLDLAEQLYGRRATSSYGRVPHVSRCMIVSTGGRLAGLKSVPLV
jgi:hypothetical protein